MLVQFNENVKHQINEDVAAQIATLNAKMDIMSSGAAVVPAEGQTPSQPTRRSQWLTKFGITEDNAEKPMGLELPVTRV